MTKQPQDPPLHATPNSLYAANGTCIPSFTQTANFEIPEVPLPNYLIHHSPTTPTASSPWTISRSLNLNPAASKIPQTTSITHQKLALDLIDDVLWRSRGGISAHSIGVWNTLFSYPIPFYGAIPTNDPYSYYTTPKLYRRCSTTTTIRILEWVSATPREDQMFFSL